MSSYRETFALAAPVAGAADAHGQTPYTYPILTRAAAKQITINETSTSAPAADLTTNALVFEVRTNRPIAVGWQVTWRGALYKVIAADTSVDLKARVTLAPW